MGESWGETTRSTRGLDATVVRNTGQFVQHIRRNLPNGRGGRFIAALRNKVVATGGLAYASYLRSCKPPRALCLNEGGLAALDKSSLPAFSSLTRPPASGTGAAKP